jgi:hypothetical protein
MENMKLHAVNPESIAPSVILFLIDLPEDKFSLALSLGHYFLFNYHVCVCAWLVNTGRAEVISHQQQGRTRFSYLRSPGRQAAASCMSKEGARKETVKVISICLRPHLAASSDTVNELYNCELLEEFCLLFNLKRSICQKISRRYTAPRGTHARSSFLM